MPKFKPAALLLTMAALVYQPLRLSARLGNQARQLRAVRSVRVGFAQPRVVLRRQAVGGVTAQAVAERLTAGSSPNSQQDLGAAPPFSLADIRAAIPDKCWERNAWRSASYLLKDVLIVTALAAGAAAVNSWFLWPVYWFAQGTMFWALFVVGHDCGHRSFSSNNTLNDVVGLITHSSILVPYHGWRISHRTHHANHGHVENDESWHPESKALYDTLGWSQKFGRHTLIAMLAYPFYLISRSPGKNGSHYDPSTNLFVPAERNMIITSNVCLGVMYSILAAGVAIAGPLAMFKLYLMPWLVYLVWLDAVTYLHHHGPSEGNVPWYRGAEWSYLRGGLSTLDRDFGIFNTIHHNIETHVIHHLFPQIPHYHLVEATQATLPVLGPYYRTPEPAPFGVPIQLVGSLAKSFANDHYVANDGEIVYYQKDPKFWEGFLPAASK